MTAEDYLSRALKIDAEIKDLEQERESAYLRATSTTRSLSPISGASGSVNPHKFDALAEYDNIIFHRFNDLYRVKTETLRTIYTVAEREYRIVLIEHYLSGYNWETIAKHMNFSSRYIRRLHGAALIAIENAIQC